MLAAVAATENRARGGQVDPGMSPNEAETPQATIRRLSAETPIRAMAASIEAIERWPPKNDELARRSTLALRIGSCDSASLILRESTSGLRSAAMSFCTTAGIVGSSTLPAAMSLMKFGARLTGASCTSATRTSGLRVNAGMYVWSMSAAASTALSVKPTVLSKWRPPTRPSAS